MTTATAAAAKGLGDARLGLAGIGGVTVGMSLAEASAAAGVPIMIDPARDLGRGCAFARAAGGPPGLEFMVDEGRIVRFDVMAGSAIRTLSGIGVGATETEVLAAYSGRIETQPHPYGGPEGKHYLVFTPADAADQHLSLIFETDGQRVTRFRSGLADPVSWIEGCA